VSSSSDPAEGGEPDGTDPASVEKERPPKRKRRPLGETLGGVIVGFDYQVFRATKPPTELVESAKPVAPVAASDGGNLSIELPDDRPAPTEDREP
jgi:hypothetical protein